MARRPISWITWEACEKIHGELPEFEAPLKSAPPVEEKNYTEEEMRVWKKIAKKVLEDDHKGEKKYCHYDPDLLEDEKTGDEFSFCDRLL